MKEPAPIKPGSTIKFNTPCRLLCLLFCLNIIQSTADEMPTNDQASTDQKITPAEAVDGDKWFHQTQLPWGGSWFNNELQHYTNRIDNAYVSNGSLKIVAKRETFHDQGQTKQFTSARLNSKYAFKYGRVVVRAKLPTGVGTWPAIWTLGKNINEAGAYWQTQGFGTTIWPACGEIDIIEHWGSNQNFVQSAMHTPSSHGGTINHGGQVISTVSTQFHSYEMDWQRDKIIFSVDGVEHYRYAPSIRNASTWPYTDEQYLLLNIAIEPKIATNFTQSAMEIDYVRIYAEGASASDQPIWADEFNPSSVPVKTKVPH
jgi:beta-glucanase (GH16 family)